MKNKVVRTNYNKTNNLFNYKNKSLDFKKKTNNIRTRLTNMTLLSLNTSHKRNKYKNAFQKCVKNSENVITVFQF